MSYADLAAIMLSAVSVIVTVLGVVIAILALWGFRHFKETAQKAASARVDEPTPDITRTVEAAVPVHIRPPSGSKSHVSARTISGGITPLLCGSNGTVAAVTISLIVYFSCSAKM